MEGMGARYRCRLQVGAIPDNSSIELIIKLLSNVWLRSHPKLPDPCWIRGKDQSVYTAIRYNGKPVNAHRVSYELFTGKKLLNDGCHHCDVRACINPNHIFDGTDRQNQLDSRIKDRAYKPVSSNFKSRVDIAEEKLNNAYKENKLLVTYDFNNIATRLRNLTGEQNVVNR